MRTRPVGPVRYHGRSLVARKTGRWKILIRPFVPVCPFLPFLFENPKFVLSHLPYFCIFSKSCLRLSANCGRKFIFKAHEFENKPERPFMSPFFLGDMPPRFVSPQIPVTFGKIIIFMSIAIWNMFEDTETLTETDFGFCIVKDVVEGTTRTQ